MWEPGAPDHPWTMPLLAGAGVEVLLLLAETALLDFRGAGGAFLGVGGGGEGEGVCGFLIVGAIVVWGGEDVLLVLLYVRIWCVGDVCDNFAMKSRCFDLV